MDSIYPFLTRRRFLSNSLYHSPSFSFFLSPFAFQLTDHSFLVVLFLFQTTRHCSSKRESLQCRFVTRSCASARTNTSLFIFYLSRTMVLLRLSPLDSHDLRLPLSRSSSSSSFYLFLPLFPFFFLSFLLSFFLTHTRYLTSGIESSASCTIVKDFGTPSASLSSNWPILPTDHRDTIFFLPAIYSTRNT